MCHLVRNSAPLSKMIPPPPTQAATTESGSYLRVASKSLKIQFSCLRAATTWEQRLIERVRKLSGEAVTLWLLSVHTREVCSGQHFSSKSFCMATLLTKTHTHAYGLRVHAYRVPAIQRCSTSELSKFHVRHASCLI